MKLIVDTPDYFAALTEDGGARVGMTGERCLQVPAGHPLHAEITACRTEADAEAVFDRAVEAGLIVI